MAQSVQVSWTAPTTFTSGSALPTSSSLGVTFPEVSYNITCTPSNSAVPTTLTYSSTFPAQTTFTAEFEDGTYTITVTPVFGSYTGATESITITVPTALTDTSPLSAPTLVVATQQTSGLQITWETVTTLTDGSAVPVGLLAGYNIYMDSNILIASGIAPLGPEGFYTYSPATPDPVGTTHTFYVVAVATVPAQTSAPSASTSATIFAPSAVTGLSVTYGSGS